MSTSPKAILGLIKRKHVLKNIFIYEKEKEMILTGLVSI
jgi:hypothetical protein